MIKSLIFDLGNVLYLLNEKNFTECFASKGVDLKNFYSKELFEIIKLYETGKISTLLFFEKAVNILNIKLNFTDFQYCWNSLLSGFIRENTDLVNFLSLKYPTFILSNINELHCKKVVADEVFRSLRLKKIYFSHLIGQRKPDKKSFELIIAENGLIQSETLFIDDSPLNIQKAKNYGLKTLLLESPFLLRKKIARIIRI